MVRLLFAVLIGAVLALGVSYVTRGVLLAGVNGSPANAPLYNYGPPYNYGSP